MDDAMTRKKNPNDPNGLGSGWFVADDSEGNSVKGTYFKRKCDAEAYSKGEDVPAHRGTMKKGLKRTSLKFL